MKSLITAALLTCALGGAASAEGLSYGADLALGMWTNANGGMGLDSSGGIAAIDQRMTGRLNLSIAKDFGGFVGQADLFYQTLQPAKLSADEDDATSHMTDVTLRAMRNYGDARVGLFMGYGAQNDYGDSGDYMSYGFYGIDASKDTSFGQVYGQVGYLDSHDEYHEGLNEAWFIRAGGETEIASGMTLFGAVSYSKGAIWEGYRGYVNGLELGIEKDLGNGLSVYGSIDYTQQYYQATNSDDQYGDNFATAWVGVKLNLDGKESRAKKLPQIGTWVSYFANEIE